MNKNERKAWKRPTEEAMKRIRKQLLKEHGNEWYVKTYTKMFDKSNMRKYS